MAHAPELRARARTLYVAAGRSLGRIARETGVSRATLARWSAEEDWGELRAQSRELEREAARLALELTRAARESADPQQAYGALQAAKLAGLAEPQPLNPPPAAVAKALLAALATDAELGPIVRRRRREILDLVVREVERLEGQAA